MLSQELTELLKKHYLTGCHAYTYLKVSGNGWEQMVKLLARRGELKPDPPTIGLTSSGISLPPIFGIPVRTDDALPPNVWELRNSETDEVLKTGLLESSK